MQINPDLRITDGSYYNMPLDDVAKNAIYSTDEIIVGRWINAKPIYRKVIVLESPSEDTEINLSNLKISEICKIDVTGYGADGINVNFGNVYTMFGSSVQQQRIFYRRSTGVLVYRYTDFRIARAVITIEYTKTTD